MTNPSESDIRYREAIEQGIAKKAEQLLHKSMQKSSHNARKVEREILQYASSQNIPVTDINTAEELSTTSPELAAEMKMKKSLSFKNPGAGDPLCPVTAIN